MGLRGLGWGWGKLGWHCDVVPCEVGGGFAVMYIDAYLFRAVRLVVSPEAVRCGFALLCSPRFVTRVISSIELRHEDTTAIATRGTKR